MITTIGILIGSLALFVYWFRYSCVLILTAKTSYDYALEVATANGLGFVNFAAPVTAAGRSELDRLHASLDRDYHIVSGLLRHAGSANLSGSMVEDLMLRVDYRIMNTCYKLTRTLSPVHAAKAMSEMADIVTYFANAMGERSLCSAEF